MTNFSMEKENLFPGIWVYRNILKPELDIINRVEKVMNSGHQYYKWQEALVGYMEKIPEYRDCVDFKLRPLEQYPMSGDVERELGKIWQDAYDAQIAATDDYCYMHNIKMDYWEVMNFIRYGENQHFQEHADHGFSYMATVSVVGYPNDDYEGGELVFPKIGLTIKPRAGDVYMFPSTYIYSHRAMPVTKGIKYSLVTMLDYNDNAHNDEYYELRDRRIREGKQKPTVSR